MHVALLSPVNSWEFDVTTHQVIAVEDEGSLVMCSCRLAFVPMDIAQVVLEVIRMVSPPSLLSFRAVPTDCSCTWPSGSLNTPEISCRRNIPPVSQEHTWRSPSGPIRRHWH